MTVPLESETVMTLAPSAIAFSIVYCATLLEPDTETSRPSNERPEHFSVSVHAPILKFVERAHASWNLPLLAPLFAKSGISRNTARCKYPPGSSRVRQHFRITLKG